MHWGKLKFYFDGEEASRIECEAKDFFGGQYGLIDVFGQVNGSTTAYRFWPGKIHFNKSILISTEHGNHNDTPADYSSLVYYYVPD